MKTNPLQVQLGSLTLSNPIMPASGCFGYGEEIGQLYDLSKLGAIVTKATTLEPRIGNPLPRIAETTSGMLNSIGLQNPGVHHVLEHELPFLAQYQSPVLVNVAGSTLEEMEQVIMLLEESAGVTGYEINISCPNVSAGGMSFGQNPQSVFELTARLRKLTQRFLVVKLSPNVSDIVSIARAAEEGGADSVSLINTLLGMSIDTRTGKPILARGYGGLSGPAIKPVALYMVYQVSQAISIPVIGIGGIMNIDDVLQFLMAGATAVEIGTAHFRNPLICSQLIDELAETLQERGWRSVEEVIGMAWKNSADKKGEKLNATVVAGKDLCRL